jgi:hypothetical protein
LAFQRGDELLEDRALHIDALGAQADLAAVLEGAARDAGDGLVEVGVGEHDAGVLAAQLEGLTGRTPRAAAAMMASPVRVSPVKVMPLTPGCWVMNSPAEPGPKPCSTWYTPLGTPTAFITSPSSVAVAGFLRTA